MLALWKSRRSFSVIRCDSRFTHAPQVSRTYSSAARLTIEARSLEELGGFSRRYLRSSSSSQKMQR